MNDTSAFARRAPGILAAWVALLALMFASLGSAYLPLGPWNAVIGLAVAALKSAIVLCCFMRLTQGGPLPRLVAAAGVFMLALLAGLSSVDYATRAVEPAATQAPQQLRPLRQGGAVR